MLFEVFDTKVRFYIQTVFFEGENRGESLKAQKRGCHPAASVYINCKGELIFGFEQAVAAVISLINNADRICIAVKVYEEVVTEHLELKDSILRCHGS